MENIVDNDLILPGRVTQYRQLNANSIGLFNGKAGQVILLYLVSQISNKEILRNNAQLLLDAIAENIAQTESLNFSDGLAGIGWMVEWIAQNGFMDMNTNEILEDIDDTLYKSVIYSSRENISLGSGTLGKFLFFWSRFKSKNPNTQRLKNIFHEECLVLLSDDLHDKLCGGEGILSTSSISADDLKNVAQTVYFFSDFLNSKINEPTVEKVLYECMDFLDKYLSNFIDQLNNTQLSLSGDFKAELYLSSCFYIAGKNHQLCIWQQKGLEYLKYFRNAYQAVDGSDMSLGVIMSDLLENKNIQVENISDLLGFSLVDMQSKKLLYELMTKKLVSFEISIPLMLLE